MRSENEFNWTPIPALYVYCAYRINKNAINDKELRDKFSLLYGVNQKRTIESKISNYRYLSGEGRGLKNGAIIAKIIVDEFGPATEVQLEEIYNGLDNQKGLVTAHREMIISITRKWLMEMPLSKANRYLKQAIDHGLNIDGFEELFEDLLRTKIKTKKGHNSRKIDERDREYQEEINQTTLPHFNPDENRSPKKTVNGESWYRNPRLALWCLERAKFNCMLSSRHKTFTSIATNRNFVEAHHLIPMSYQDEFTVNLDCPENIVVLCPNCHRLVHHALKRERLPILKKLFETKKKELKEAGINIKLTQLYEFYFE